MPIDVHPKRRVPTSTEVIEEQKRVARSLKEQQQAARAAANVPAKVATAAPATLAVDTRTPEERYIDEIAPSMIVGQLVRFSKEGKFTVVETDQEISPDEDFICLADEVLIGYVNFGDDDNLPQRQMGQLYKGFQMPKRESLGDLDPADWPQGLSGQPEDPWKHQMLLPLQEPRSSACFTFATTSVTGRRAVGNLLRHYDRLRRTDPDSYPVVKLKPSGFQHRDERIGFVATPLFAVVGRAPRASAAKPDTSAAADMNDALPF